MSSRHALTNCTVYLGDGERIDNGYVVFAGERIQEVGAMVDYARSAGVEAIDLGGKLLLPGLVDSHLHLTAYAISLIEIDLADTYSLEAGLEAIRARADRTPRGSWIRGRGWDKQRWGLSDFPTRWMLDRVAPDNPVLLTSRDGHLAWLNSAALALVGYAEQALRVEGGEMSVDRQGVPTGIFKEKAAGLALERAGGPGEQQVVDAIGGACGRLRRCGLTAVHTIESQALSGPLDRAVAEGLVSLDLFRMREVLEPDEIAGLVGLPGVQCIKTYADGTLGSQTASMLEPFAGQPGNVGIAFAPREKLWDIVTRSVDAGFAMSVHAIGDRANMEVLDIYEGVRRSSRGRQTLLRVEHAQILRSEDMPRFGVLAVPASMQPIHLVADRAVADRYWGDRSGNAYAWKRILETGGVVAFGSDAPIESPDPLRGIHAAVTRRGPAEPDSSPWYPRERLATWQCLDCYTLGGATACGRVRDTGRVSAGYRANLTVLDTDILSVADPDQILGARVVGTVVGGVSEFYA